MSTINESLSLLLAEATTLPSTTSAASATNPQTNPRDKKRADGRRQFTLASLPFLTIYLQGTPSHLPPSLSTNPSAITLLPEDLALAHSLGTLKLRALPYPMLPTATRSHYLTKFRTLVADGKAFSAEWLAALKELITANPILLESTTLARIQDEFLSSTRASQALDDWLATLPPLPTTPASIPSCSLTLDELSII